MKRRERIKLSARDEAVVRLVGRFKQMTTAHVRSSLFAEVASATPCDRSLRRLVDADYLRRISRLVGGENGGSRQYAYQLGRQGWRLVERSGTYWAARTVNQHTLEIADHYVQLLRLEHGGDFNLLQFITEPDCHRQIGDIKLTPDAYVEAGVLSEGLKHSYFLELDRGSEGKAALIAKCQRYWRAYCQWPEQLFPLVRFVVPDTSRETVLREVIQAGPMEAHQLFNVLLR